MSTSIINVHSNQDPRVNQVILDHLGCREELDKEDHVDQLKCNTGILGPQVPAGEKGTKGKLGDMGQRGEPGIKGMKGNIVYQSYMGSCSTT